MRQLEKLPPEQRVKLQAEVMTATKNLKFIPNPGPQRMAYITPAEVLLYGGSGGAGKGFTENEPVLTPFGFRKIKDLKVGSAICAVDGTVQKIIGYYERGEQPVYKLTWSDGEETVCDEDHIWTGWFAGPSRKIGNKKTTGVAAAENVTTKQLFEYYQKNNERKEPFTIPAMEAPCAFNVAGENKGPYKHISRVIPPYVLGVLLGDGCLTKPCLEFSSADTEIVDNVQKSMNERFGAVEITSNGKEGTECRSYRILGVNFRDHVEDLGLRYKVSETKFIPRIYLLASVEERFELLQGLMDTDGTVSQNQTCHYTTVSPQLARDVAALARSLGAIVRQTDKIPTYEYKGEKLQGQLAYTLYIKMPEMQRMFRLTRKRVLIDGKVPQSMGISLSAIEACGQERTICLRVSHPSSLFVVGAYRVTHNSALLTGLALTAHHRSLLLRRKYSDLSALSEDLVAMNKSRNGFTSAPRPKLRTDDGRFIEFGACQHAGDEEDFQGQAHDLKAFDEVSQFLEKQVRFIIGWNRLATGVPRTQRCRVVFASNPPTSSDGDWLIGFFRPWLDPTHSNPAKHGELRWFITTPDGKDQEVKGPEPVECPGRKDPLIPRSRTFIPGKLADNPFLAKSGYASVLDGLPEPLRSAIRDGNFMLSRSDDAFQCIPSDWVRAAVGRWETHKPMGVPMCAIGCDPAQGGQDQTVLAIRYDGWFDNLVAVPGEKTPLGTDVAALLVKHRKDGAEIIIDMGGGYGSSPYDHLRANEVKCYAYKGAEASTKKDMSGKIGFANRRSEVWWKFREALDPAQPGGSSICLPPDPMLISDLTAPKFEYNTRGIKVEPKEDVKDRLGRSTDKGDAVVLAWSEGSKGHKPTHPAQGSSGRNRGPLPQVVRGYKNRK